MSYILHALKKSEEERTKGSVPRVTTVHEGNGAPRTRFWAVLAVAALVVLTGNAVVLGLGLWGGVEELHPADSAAAPAGQRDAGSPVTEPAQSVPASKPAQSEPVNEPAQSASVSEPAQSASVSEPASSPGPALPGVTDDGPPSPSAAPETAQFAALLSPAAGPGTGLEVEPDPPAPPVVVVRRQDPAPAPPPRKPDTAMPSMPAVDPGPSPRPLAARSAPPDGETAAPAEQLAALNEPAASETEARRSVPELWQLPSQIRSEIPALSISVHVYSPEEPRRFVIVDRRKYWEGDLLDGGLLLESILPDGVILEFRGRQFKLRSG